MSIHEERARELKCERVAQQVIADILKIMPTMTEQDWTDLAARAGVNMPSETSRARIIEMLEALTK